MTAINITKKKHDIAIITASNDLERPSGTGSGSGTTTTGGGGGGGGL